MRNLLLMMIVMFGSFGKLRAQEDTSLVGRLNIMLAYTEKMDIEKTFDYTYPHLFTLVSKEDLLQLMKNSMENEEMSIRMDSLVIDSIFPRFHFEKGEYAKIRYKMNLYFHLKDSVDESGEKIEPGTMLDIYKLTFGESNVSYNPIKNEYLVRTVSEMVAIKDEISPLWTFVNLEASNPLGSMLLGDNLLKELEKYQ